MTRPSSKPSSPSKARVPRPRSLDPSPSRARSRVRTFLRRGWGQVRNIGEWRTSTKLMILLLVVAFLAIFVVSSLSVQNGVATVTRVEERILTNYASSVALQVDNQVLQYRHDAVQV